MPSPTVLQRSPLFHGFDVEQRRAVMSCGAPKTVPAGHVFLQMGQENKTLFVVESGHVVVTRAGSEAESELAVLGPGDTFGEMTFLDGSRASATLTAKDETHVIEFQREELEPVLANDSKLASALWLNLATELKRRLVATNELVDYYFDVNQLLAKDSKCADLLSHT